MSSSIASAPPAYDDSKSYPVAYSAAGQGVPMQPIVGPQAAPYPSPGYPVQAGTQYPTANPYNYGQPPPAFQPVPPGQFGIQQYPGMYPTTNVVYTQQQQPQTQVIVGSPPVNYIPHIVFSCLVTWCCCCCCGLIAFILAMYAHNYSRMQQATASSYAWASLGFSIAGVVTGVIAVVVIVVLTNSPSCVFYILGNCYKFRESWHSLDWTNCHGRYFEGFCYYN